MVIQVVIYTLGTFAFLKGLIILIFNKPVLKLAKKWIKDHKKIKQIALLELVLGIILLLMGYLL